MCHVEDRSADEVKPPRVRAAGRVQLKHIRINCFSHVSRDVEEGVVVDLEAAAAGLSLVLVHGGDTTLAGRARELIYPPRRNSGQARLLRARRGQPRVFFIG